MQHRLETVEQKAHIQTYLTGEYRFRLPGNVEENLYRVSQEALNLLIKNSQATEVKVQLASDYDSIVVEISYNGVGLDQIGENAIADLREKVEAIGGKLIIDSSPDKRTTLLIKV